MISAMRGSNMPSVFGIVIMKAATSPPRFRSSSPRSTFFFFTQKTAYEFGLGIPAEPLFRSRHGSDKTLQVGYANHFYRSAHKSAQIYARFDKNDWRIQPAEFYRFHDAEVNTFGYF